MKTFYSTEISLSNELYGNNFFKLTSFVIIVEAE